VTVPPIVTATPRLDIRVWDEAELPDLHAIVSDPVTMRAWPEPFHLVRTQRWMIGRREEFEERGTGRWALVRRDDGAFIGDAGLVPATVAGRSILDLGYIVHHPYWRQGYGFEAASALVRYAFETLDAPAVHAHMALDNTASWTLAEKLGMRAVGEFPHEGDRGKMHRLYELRR
jgi:RimJ/RimL family protein N-acetyltransferase